MLVVHGAKAKYESVIGAYGYEDKLTLISLMILVVLCGIIMIYCNIKAWYNISRYNNVLADANVITADISRARNIKMLKMVSVIVSTFIVCYSLGLILFFLTKVFAQVISIFWTRFIFIIYVSNFANNVFVYGTPDKIYRKEAKAILL